MLETPSRTDHPDPIRSEKEDQIEQIDKAHAEAFQAWVHNDENKRNLALPPDAAQYLIPRKLLEISSDPAKVSVVVIEADHESIQFAIVENMDHDVSDLTAYDRLHDPIDPTLPPPPFPANVDPMHYKLMGAVDDGLIGLDQKPLYWITLGKYDEEDTADETKPRGELFVEHLDDSEDIRGKHVTEDFYKNRFRDIAKALGFRYITGENTRPNLDAKNEAEKRGSLSYFVEKLGRKTLSQLPAQKQLYFQKNHHNFLGDPDIFTIEDLYPQDTPHSPTQ